ncbi:1-(5-phosphoribosyl)-5-[(5-phosphoribosylamino) methylideneamino] imidazole-4-carboxamide isomerase [Leptospira ryugenii]|uniref:1-(5-phosphoribosyl)-5-[(5-phosphoribosylamino)methylideneamino] imidazole-4-carboxamide isomerase n=1 Tax=Leptospira ryugenii TaxID=1917863 RepID=A0A2P2DZ91_9LEPT|nr:1-(5-phosphoribosyl)-5-[(5-phosphoribosylamino)methylideneamino]imidazole-4-carboxamide isomerase [Leptospira ryugenii]GBF49942.1 1-(5-phosphoribosyl)-5-[(5-phosphoribosylamino) methylideneamino] imidazole-4-carboxamide isomerase [Leptospira ryugenii]
MFILPAVDLLDDEAVRLLQGDYSKKTVYSSHPEELAKKFESDGAEILHIVDLNAAKSGVSKNQKSIKKIRENCKMKLELGGGIRNDEAIQFFDDLGIDRFILGTIAVENPKFVEQSLAKYGVDRIVVGVDAKNGTIRTKGWETDSGLSALDFLRQLHEIGVRHIIYTDISKDGMLIGPNFSIYQTILTIYPDFHLIASGGVSSLADLKELHRLTNGTLYGAIAGKAIYESKLNLKQALKEFKEYQKG